MAVVVDTSPRPASLTGAANVISGYPFDTIKVCEATGSALWLIDFLDHVSSPHLAEDSHQGWMGVAGLHHIARCMWINLCAWAPWQSGLAP